MFTVGIAGHIDHGKSSLVQALTDMEMDRLPDEKRKGMTIDLGFAWLPLSQGEIVGIVDVPGHKDFVRNVIPGLWGVDAAILVVAGDDGWMPQTEEHVRILEFLRIQQGIVAISKIDLTPDPEWLDMVEEDILGRLHETSLRDFSVVRVSAKEGINIKALKDGIRSLAGSARPKRDIGKPRLHIDRVFTIKGSGTVVTGTLIDGSISQGETVAVFPGCVSSRVRALESYKRKTDRAEPGNRVAVNLVGIEKRQLKRGDVLFGQGDQIISGHSIDVSLRLISPIPRPLSNNTEVMVHLGTREIPGRLKLVQGKALQAGESAFAQFRFKEPVASRIGDHFVIRRPSPPATIGGGTVLDPMAERHRARDMENVISFLRARTILEVKPLILSELNKCKFVKLQDLLVAGPFSSGEITDGVNTLEKDREVVVFDPWVIDSVYWQGRVQKVLDILAQAHRRHPLEEGVNQAELSNRLNCPRSLAIVLVKSLERTGKIARTGETLALPSHRPTPSENQRRLISDILQLFERHPESPPTKGELIQKIPGSVDVVQFMCRQDMILELPEGILLETKQYERIKTEILEILRRKGTISIQEVRGLFGFSRKYILPLMAKLDKEGVTRKEGDERVLAEAYIQSSQG